MAGKLITPARSTGFLSAVVTWGMLIDGQQFVTARVWVGRGHGNGSRTARGRVWGNAVEACPQGLSLSFAMTRSVHLPLEISALRKRTDTLIRKWCDCIKINVLPFQKASIF